jgi:hypothetical protein
MENIFVEFLPPWIETGLQPAFYDKESGTVLQQTARMYARVNMLIRMFNKLSKNTKTEVERFETAVNEDMAQYKHDINETVADYIERFNQLHDYVHDYFDNLDVQEEINNKLDEMTEEGTLQEIIADYLNSKAIFGFDVVADMITATNLQDGSYARTRGYYTINDLGGVDYAIKSTSTSPFAILLNNGLYAEPVMQESMNVLQLGIRGSDTPNTPKMQSAIDACNSLTFNDETYTINGFLSLHENSHINLNGANLNFSVRYGFKNLKPTDTVTGYNGASNITIENGKITGGALVIGHGKNITIKNLELIDCLNDHWIEIGGCKNVTVENCKFGGRPNASGGGFTSTSFSSVNIDPVLESAFPHYSESSTSYDGTLCEDIYILNNVMNPLEHLDNSITTCRGIDIHYEATEISNHNNIVVSDNVIYGFGTYLNLFYHVDRLEFCNNKLIPKIPCNQIVLGFTNYAHIHDNIYSLPLNGANPSTPITIRENRPNLKMSYYSNTYEHLMGTSFNAEIYFQTGSSYSFIRMDLTRIWTGTNAPGTGYTFPVDYTKFNHMYIGVGTGGNLKSADFRSYATRFFESGDALRTPTIDGRIVISLQADNKYDYTNTTTSDTGNNVNLRYIYVGVD